MRKFGLIGKTLKHSFSKSYFEEKFQKENLKDCSYQLFEFDSIEKVENIFNDKEIIGLNVTIPYKESIISYLDEIDAKAKEIGAVNTIFIQNNKKIGYNTDYYGFKNSLINFIDNNVKTALILGNGGASKAVQVVLKDLNIAFEVVSRKSEINFENLTDETIFNSNLIINTTPLGTYPNVNEFPIINFDAIPSKSYFYDLIYNPNETQFLNEGKKRGAKVTNGLKMLYLQAEKSWNFWNKQ